MDYFHVRLSLDHDLAHLHLQGELDVAAVPRLVESFDEVCADEQCSLIVVDLSELKFCDSPGIRTLVQVAERCRKDGTVLRVVGAQGTVRQVFNLTQTAELLGLDGDNE